MSDKHESTEVLLARIDERTKRLEDDFIDFKDKLESNFVTKEEFNPVRSIVYSFCGLILMGVIGAIIALVIKTP